MNKVDLLESVTDSLRAMLPEQRWFAGKGFPIYDVTPVRATVLGGKDPQLLHAIVAVDQGKPHRDRYQLLLGLRSELPESLGHAWVGTAGDRAVYQAVHDPELTPLLLTLMAEHAEVEGIRFSTEPGVTLDTTLRPRPVGVEQSNTSLVYGQTYILKLYRKLDAGLSPDLEVHRALAAVGCAHIATPLGSIEGELDGHAVTYGMLTEYLRSTAEGWAMATASVRDFMAASMLANGASGRVERPHPSQVGGDFASEAYRLGSAVAAVHTDLATALGSSLAPAGYLDEVANHMHYRLNAALKQVPELVPHEAALRAAFDAVRTVVAPVPAQRVIADRPRHSVPIQRVHGDLHLGQVLRSVTGWILIDFEGEPMASLAERITPASPLRDIAGMLRSFDYAANHMPLGDADPELRALAAQEWADRNQNAFCDGYAEVASDPREQAVLLRAFELDKAVYEVGYERNNRPPWLPIPLAAIARLTSDH